MISVNAQQHSGYEVAHTFDGLIQDELKNMPIECVPFHWLTFLRTLRTTIDTLTKVAETNALRQVSDERTPTQHT